MCKEEWLARFSRNLYDRICDSGYSNREIAEMLGMNHSAFCRYVTSRAGCSRIPPVYIILNLSYILHCSVDDLIDFGEPIENETRNRSQDVRDIFEKKMYRERLREDVEEILSDDNY